MFERILKLSIRFRWAVICTAMLLAALGALSFQRLAIDAVPDITNVQVQINTAVPGYAPIEIEQRITFPVENALAGIPKLDYTRSLSRYGLSQVTAVFDDGTDIYFARQQINEKLQEVRELLPEGITPTMGPIATGLGEIFMYSVENKPGAQPERSATELRTIQDWIIKPQLRTTPGVTEVNTIGGFQKQYHVLPRLDSLRAYDLTLDDIADAIAENSASVGAGYIEEKGEQYLIRIPGQLTDPSELERIPVRTHDSSPIRVGDIAEIAIGHELRTGAATENGREVVLGTVFMLMGANSREVSRAVAERLDEINRSLPEGVVARPVYDRTTLVNATIATVRNNLSEGALLVILVLFTMLGNFRAALITACVIPLAMLMTISGMVYAGISGNLMSLGALDFGLIVDGAVILVENCLRRLGQEQQRLGRVLDLKERLRVVYDGSREVRRATMFGELIIMIVYVPILALSGVEGKMFHPMAITVILALLAATILSITFVPAAVAIFIRGTIAEHEPKLILKLQGLYERALRAAFRAGWLVLGGALALLVASALLFRTLGAEFIPRLDEGDIALHALRIPGTGLNQAVEMQHVLEEKLKSLPEVRLVFAKIGTAEIATDPMPPSVADGFVMLKPREEWPDPRLPKAELVRRLEALAKQVPGNNYEFTQPIEMRFNELIAGVRSDIAVKVFGDDIPTLLQSAEAIADELRKVRGAADVKVEQLTGLPTLTVQIDREKLARFGLPLSFVQKVVQIALAGLPIATVFEGDKRFPVVLRLSDVVRKDPDAVGQIPIPLKEVVNKADSLSVVTERVRGLSHDPLSPSIRLSQVASIQLAEGPNQISRENGKRRIVVTSNVRGRDLGSFVDEAQERIAESVRLPAGYWLDWGGQFEHLISSKQRLELVVPLALSLIFLLLYATFGSARDACAVFTGVPLALTGGVFSLWLRGIPFSVSAAVGFIAVSGVAVLNGLVMISVIRRLHLQGTPLREATITGATSRLRPVLMTALVASLGFLPMAVSVGTGAEVQRPLATVVIGGIISSTTLTLFVLPLIYSLLAPRRE